MTIKPLAPEKCPRCGDHQSFVISEKQISCTVCGYVVRDANGKPAPLRDITSPKRPMPETIRRRNLKPTYRVITHGEIDTWARAAFDTGIDYVRQEKWDEAIKSFLRAIENQRDFIDPHLWIAYVSDDPVVKEDHLTTVLSYQPNLMEAIQELMIVRGELDSNAVAASNDPHAQARMQRSGGAVDVQSINVRCPRCGSTEMTVDSLTGLATCGSCNFVDEKSRQREEGGGILTLALLKRRYQPVVWEVGERFLECDTCGAKRTIPARDLAARCPFCSSTHVFERDALDSFQQPDGLVQFRLKHDAAEAALNEKLSGWQERMKGWLSDNRVKQMTLEPLFLPYWVFDAGLEIRKSTFRENTGVGMTRNSSYSFTQTSPYETATIADAINNVPVCAVKSPSPHLTGKLGDYDLSEVVAYSPKLLAKVPAELYSMDFDKASLEARKTIGDVMKEKYGTDTNPNTRINIFTSVNQMSFRFLLFPVWVATIMEIDGDSRSALVNGQNGTVALGKAQKPGQS
ncbi:MAG: TFIIB-type zinc ribbon-containing protein [Aggregatilineales bacterium]